MPVAASPWQPNDSAEPHVATSVCCAQRAYRGVRTRAQGTGFMPSGKAKLPDTAQLALAACARRRDPDVVFTHGHPDTVGRAGLIRRSIVRQCRLSI